MFEFGAIMQDVACSLHFATLTHVWSAQAHCFHIGRKWANASFQAVELNQAFLWRSQPPQKCIILLHNQFVDRRQVTVPGFDTTLFQVKPCDLYRIKYFSLIIFFF